MSDLTELIQNALKERDSATATASADLHEVTEQFSKAIAAITNGAATLALEALDPSETAAGKGADPFALLLCWNHDERIVRVAELGPDGYPIKFFPAVTAWRERVDLPGTRMIALRWRNTSRNSSRSATRMSWPCSGSSSATRPSNRPTRRDTFSTCQPA